MNSLSYGNFEMTDKSEHDQYLCIDNDCAACSYKAAKLSTNDVLAAVISNELTPTEKTVVNLYWFRKMKINQIAAYSGVSETSVRKTLDRACRRIEAIMKYIVLYNEMLDGRTKLPEKLEIKIIRSNDGKELIAG